MVPTALSARLGIQKGPRSANRVMSEDGFKFPDFSEASRGITVDFHDLFWISIRCHPSNLIVLKPFVVQTKMVFRKIYYIYICIKQGNFVNL